MPVMSPKLGEVLVNSTVPSSVIPACPESITL